MKDYERGTISLDQPRCVLCVGVIILKSVLVLIFCGLW